jgi:hypothetical protein
LVFCDQLSLKFEFNIFFWFSPACYIACSVFPIYFLFSFSFESLQIGRIEIWV